MDASAFLAGVAKLRHDGYRLMLINATSVVAEGAVDLAWSFEKDGAIEHLRERVPAGDEVPSIQASYPYAFLYENEIVELFGLKITGLVVDFKGQLYQTSAKVPMSPKAIRERLEAAKGKKQ